MTRMLEIARQSLVAKVKVIRGGDAAHSALAVELSQRGILLKGVASTLRGDKVQVSFPTPGLRQPVRLEGRVVRARGYTTIVRLEPMDLVTRAQLWLAASHAMQGTSARALNLTEPRYNA